MTSHKIISVVVPVFNEEKNIPILTEKITGIFATLPEYECEIVFVNDGSADNSFLEIYNLAQRDPRVKGLDFSRNFGKEAATSAGCHFASGDAVITMDADLQHPVEIIPDFLKLWEAGNDVVYTVRSENKGVSWFKKVTSHGYYWLFNKLTDMPTEPRSTDFRLLDKKVIEVFRKFPERERMFRGMIDWMGYKRAKIEFVANERLHGEAQYSYRKLFRLALNSFTSFSLIPLKFAGYLGVVITLISGILLTVMFVTRWFVDASLFSPIAILATGNTFLSGITLISLGFIALYIARIHNEVINRPLYIVRDEVNMPSQEI